MEFCAHRGFLNYGENTIMGIITALQKVGRVEFDIFFYKDSWVLSHDLKSIHPHTESFSNLIYVLRNCPFKKGVLIVDIKWDLHHNKYHKFDRLLKVLSNEISSSIVGCYDWYFQVSYPLLTTDLINSPLRGKKGLIFDRFAHHINCKLDYLMIDIYAICLEDFRKIKKEHPNKIFMGYTLPSVFCIPNFKNLYPLFSFLVVDMRVEDLKFFPLKIKHGIA